MKLTKEIKFTVLWCVVGSLVGCDAHTFEARSDYSSIGDFLIYSFGGIMILAMLFLATMALSIWLESYFLDEDERYTDHKSDPILFNFMMTATVGAIAYFMAIKVQL